MKVVHYAAHGMGGTAFGCYFKDLKAHQASSYEVPGPVEGWTRTRHRVGVPRASTDVFKVTCANCLAQLAEVATARHRGVINR